MKPLEVPITDSGYPTPRDDYQSSSRSDSPDSSPNDNQLTSTPIRGNKAKSMKVHFSNFRDELSIIESTGSESVLAGNNSSHVLDGVKNFLAVSKDLKKKDRENVSLRDENESFRNENQSLRYENESLREENFSLREESKRFELDKSVLHENSNKGALNLLVPKLQLHDEDVSTEPVSSEQFKSSEKIKKELLSFITNDEDRTMLEAELKNMLICTSKVPVKVFTATATIQVDTEKMDADVQTESDDAVKVINANLQLEVDQLNSHKEVIEKKNTDLTNRLFDYEQLKANFEEDQQKLRSDLEKKLRTTQEKLTRFEGKVEELQLRLNKKRKEVEEVTSENQRLLEDKNTHDFELDEIKVHGELIEKQKKEQDENIQRLLGKINEIEKLLEDKNAVKIQLERNVENLTKEHQCLVEKLTKKADEALAKEKAAIEQLSVLQVEKNNLLKENEYLTESRQVLLDSESNLKNDVEVLAVDLRKKDTQLSITTEQIAEEKQRCVQLEAQIGNLQSLNEKLIEDKCQAEELLIELKKGKREIDHLRQQLQLQVKESGEIIRLREDAEEYSAKEKKMTEKLEQATIKEAESGVKLEEYIRIEALTIAQVNELKEETSAQKMKIDSLTQEVCTKQSAVVELEKALDDLNNQFEEFKRHANLQYEHEISVRDQQIDNLRGRLLELETYPGQTISISRKATGVQTDELVIEAKPDPSVSVAKEQPISHDVSIVSEELIPNYLVLLEERIRGLATEIRQVVAQQQHGNVSADPDVSPVHIASKILIKFSDLLDSAILENENENDINTQRQGANRLWSSLIGRIQHLATVFSSNNEKIRKELNELKDLAEQRYDVASQFHQHYQIEEKLKEEVMADYATLQELRNEELVESELLQKRLRERLESAEHKIQSNAREKLERNEEYEAELEQVTEKIKSVEIDHKRKVMKLQEEIESLTRKREFDKISMKNMKESCQTVYSKLNYLQTRNTARQKLLHHVQSLFVDLHRDGFSPTLQRQLSELGEVFNKTGLLNQDSQEVEIGKLERRILGTVNKSK